MTGKDENLKGRINLRAFEFEGQTIGTIKCLKSKFDFLKLNSTIGFLSWLGNIVERSINKNQCKFGEQF